jgi:hypothetical protein
VSSQPPQPSTRTTTTRPHWADLPEDQKNALRNQLFQFTLNEDVTLTRHSAARVIAAIAAQDLPDGEWADLGGYLQQAATSPTARHREVGTYIIWTTLESVGDAFPGKPADLYKLFSSTIQDPGQDQHPPWSQPLGYAVGARREP